MCVAARVLYAQHSGMSTAENIKIINAALTRSGHNQITSLTDGSAEAEVANANYNEIVAAAITRYPYSWARKYKELNRLSETPDDEWSYVYQLDSDLLKFVVAEVNGSPIEYEIKGTKLYCDESDNVYAEYIYQPAESFFPHDFKEAVITRMEALFLRALSDKDKEAEARDSRADYQFTLARNNDAKNKSPRDRRTSRLVSVRNA